MQPQACWILGCDALIDATHPRVLAHGREQAERPRGRAGGVAA